MAIFITRGFSFGVTELVTATKLHELVDLADWGITGQAAGDIIYYNGTDWVRLPIGTTGQYLAVNATEDAPEWITP
jgi:hypothetical protein